MALDYAGIGRLNMTLYLIVFILCVGITVAVFNPSGSGFETEITNTEFAEDTADAGGGGIAEFFGFVWGVVVGFFTFLGRALIVDIPFVPIAVRVLIATPMIILFVMLLIDYFIEFAKTISQFIDSVTPL
jgi:hypothetical protein